MYEEKEEWLETIINENNTFTLKVDKRKVKKNVKNAKKHEFYVRLPDAKSKIPPNKYKLEFDLKFDGLWVGEIEDWEEAKYNDKGEKIDVWGEIVYEDEKLDTGVIEDPEDKDKEKEEKPDEGIIEDPEDNDKEKLDEGIIEDPEDKDKKEEEP